jgi:hypothetical protein
MRIQIDDARRIHTGFRARERQPQHLAVVGLCAGAKRHGSPHQQDAQFFHRIRTQEDRR